MEYYFDIVGLRYYALQADKWKSLFNDSGRLNPDYAGRELVLRHSPSDLTTYTIEALFEGRQWGNVCDFEKVAPRSMIELMPEHALRAVVTGGCREVHSLKVMVKSDVMIQNFARNDLEEYEQWYSSACDYPSMGITQDEAQLDRLVFSLEDLLGSGSWNHDILCNMIAMGNVDLSEEMNARRLKLLTLMDNSGDADIQRDGQHLFAAIVHKGSTEERLKWADHWTTGLDDTEERKLLRMEMQHTPVEELEALLRKFPHEVFGLWQVDPVRAIATLDYAHLPRRILRLFLSLFLSWRDKQGLDHLSLPQEKVPSISAFTAQQMAILCYYLMAEEKSWDSLSKRQIASVLEAISGISASNIYKRLGFQAHFSDPCVQKDLKFVAETIRDIFPRVYSLMLSEMEV